ncbi:MAG: class I poly(R)-hydroxyalkanoic acid synthase [Oleispira antarctica]|uniref:Poly(3-hydroxyalkanoate) synthetase n=1 Tax=Oleispira antarctica RB-8 TaxID=698738 RepID=R4YLR5_OLEAN|nr:class I poly(R)-hydroxyalkanoic acid synthase [Oleispira antarctica]MBQ0794058.1 class I poly(R)-hydroxyalkanoic acid synthase [Oleispira antarctica]CCK75500.1 Poly(3-hydroxyalkanoate) synthetase [Oleispira antarctica RB-8]
MSQPVENTITDFMEMATKASDQAYRFWEKAANPKNSNEDPSASIMNDFSKAFEELGDAFYRNPTKVVADQVQLMQKQQALFQNTALKFLGKETEAVISPEKGDRRFNDAEWTDNVMFDYIKQFYLLQSKSLTDMVGDVDGLSEKSRQKVDYLLRQLVSALSPTNFAGLNPEVIRKTLETGGANLLDGMEQLLKDLDASQGGSLNISMTDMDAFKVGRNVATTKGKVVYQTDMMQLIQYSPTTENVKKRPLLVIPPFINKYYILDLREKNSYLKWLVDQGHTVFCISWVNPGPSLRDKSFEDYMLEGPVAALDAIEKATGEKEINAIGYCVGGTLLATTLSYLQKKKDERIKSATFLATLIDFKDPGEIGVFINETAISALEKQMDAVGYFDGRAMAFSFNTLREKDLFWSFFINNYLKGKRPTAFDLLYWNSDSTNLPAAMHSYYLRNMYLHNKLKEKNGLELAGVRIDLSAVKVPTYFLSTAQDHIAMWKGTYDGAKNLSGKSRFVLGGSGHIAGVVNPPEANKYGYWTNDALPETADAWYQDAKQNDGSWWTDWQDWATKEDNAQVAKRIPGDGKLTIIEDAPGSYVQAKIVNVVNK